MENFDGENKTSVFPWIVLLMIIVAGFFFYKTRQDARMKVEAEKQAMMKKEQEQKMMEEKAKRTVTVTLSEQNNSGQSGIATSVEENGKTEVTIALSGGSFTKPQPAHFHEGTCDKPGKIAYPLNEVEDGNSETVLDVALAKLKVQPPLVINVHKSSDEAKIYTACGSVE